MTEGRDRYTRINGMRMHYRETGASTSPGLVVLHGIMGNAREWDTLVAALADDFRVVSVDQRGHGETDWADDYSAAALADDLARLIPEIGGPVHLVGHSMGGMAACLCAAEHPDLVERLVMVDVAPDLLRSEWAQTELTAMLLAMADVRFPDVGAVVDEWSAGDPNVREPLVRHWAEHNLVPDADGRLAWRFDARGLVRFVTDGVSEAQLWDAVDRIAAPTLLIRGERSPVVSRGAAEEVVRRLRRGRLVEIPDGAHDLGVGKPEAVADAVHAFLTS